MIALLAISLGANVALFAVCAGLWLHGRSVARRMGRPVYTVTVGRRRWWDGIP